MLKLSGKKMKMTQVWQGDVAVPITVVKIDEKADLGELKTGDFVDVSGTSKGRGFAGVVKRYGFHGGPKTHGQKNRLRAPGSIGATAPQRVIPGRRMAGHMGVERVTVRNLSVAEVAAEQRTVSLKGAVPGAVGGKVEIRKK
jgi:large subunit ribosomal protein L3